MKHRLSMFILASASMTGFAETTVQIVPEGTKSPAKVVEVTTADVLTSEDFSNFEDGSVDSPDFSKMLAHEGTSLDYIMHDKGWHGHKVYSAGGVCALQTYNSMDLAYLMTPLNDYSGDVTITLRAKYSINEWETEDGQHMRDTGSSLSFGIRNESKREFDLCGDYPDELASIRLYPNQGWCEISITFENHSAYNDAYIIMSSPDCILIDDIKITSSVDRFIASPEILGVRDVTETSFTIDFEPVRKAFNYYVMLYTLKGYDDEGNPIYLPVLTPDVMEYLEQVGMTVEEYLDAAGYELDNPYLMYAIVQAHEKKEYTFNNLDPATDYYYAVRSHYRTTFSDPDIKPVDVLPTPIVADATSITDKSFVANWGNVINADVYKVNLYGVYQAKEDIEGFVLFEENFDKTSNLTTSTNIINPTILDELETGINIDGVTTNPGWIYGYEEFIASIVDGMVYFPCKVSTPVFSCGSSDTIEVWINGKCTEPEFTLTLEFAGEKHKMDFTSSILMDSFCLPTHGLKEGRLSITGPASILGHLFIDDIIVSQDVKKGMLAYTYLGTEQVDGNSCEFADLASDVYDFYGYGVIAERGEDESLIVSEESERMLVDLVNRLSTTGVPGIEDAVNTDSNKELEAIYSLDGTKLESVRRGVNIIVYSDGSTKKVFVR